MTTVEPYRAPARGQAANPWYFVGHTSSFPDITLGAETASIKFSKVQQASVGTATSSSCADDSEVLPPCKILQLRKDDPSSTSPASEILKASDAAATIGLQEQVLVFQYRGKFYAIDHQCPHQSYPLSRGSLHDIEDFGIILSAGIQCPKHGWAFDLTTGESDRGPYRLKVWDIELRDAERNGDASARQQEVGREVWVRKKVKARQG